MHTTEEECINSRTTAGGGGGTTIWSLPCYHLQTIMNCKGRAEAFAKSLQSKLRYISRLTGDGDDSDEEEGVGRSRQRPAPPTAIVPDRSSTRLPDDERTRLVTGKKSGGHHNGDEFFDFDIGSPEEVEERLSELRRSGGGPPVVTRQPGAGTSLPAANGEAEEAYDCESGCVSAMSSVMTEQDNNEVPDELPDPSSGSEGDEGQWTPSPSFTWTPQPPGNSPVQERRRNLSPTTDMELDSDGDDDFYALFAAAGRPFPPQDDVAAHHSVTSGHLKLGTIAEQNSIDDSSSEACDNNLPSPPWLALNLVDDPLDLAQGRASPECENSTDVVNSEREARETAASRETNEFIVFSLRSNRPPTPPPPPPPTSFQQRPACLPLASDGSDTTEQPLAGTVDGAVAMVEYESSHQLENKDTVSAGSMPEEVSSTRIDPGCDVGSRKNDSVEVRSCDNNVKDGFECVYRTVMNIELDSNHHPVQFKNTDTNELINHDFEEYNSIDTGVLDDPTVDGSSEPKLIVPCDPKDAKLITESEPVAIAKCEPHSVAQCEQNPKLTTQCNPKDPELIIQRDPELNVGCDPETLLQSESIEVVQRDPQDLVSIIHCDPELNCINPDLPNHLHAEVDVIVSAEASEVTSPEVAAAALEEVVTDSLRQLKVDIDVARGGDELLSPNSEDDRPRRIRRCSSLKTVKTPPGTPHRKKIVSFADALGLDLADVRTIFLDDLPNVPKSAFDDLEDASADTNDHQQQQHLHDIPPFGSPALSQLHHLHQRCNLVPVFPQPASLSDFDDRVRRQHVCLESATVSGSQVNAIRLVVRVANMDFHKAVMVRFTRDEWRTHCDLGADYAGPGPAASGGCDPTTDRFSTVLLADRLEAGERLCLALCYRVLGQEFWDSNDGLNYIFQCYPENVPSPLAPDDSWIHFL